MRLTSPTHNQSVVKLGLDNGRIYSLKLLPQGVMAFYKDSALLHQPKGKKGEKKI